MTSASPTRMRREIGQVAATVERILAGADEVAAVADIVRRAAPRWVTIAARGTSDHAAVYAQYYGRLPKGRGTGHDGQERQRVSRGDLGCVLHVVRVQGKDRCHDPFLRLRVPP